MTNLLAPRPAKRHPKNSEALWMLLDKNGEPGWISRRNASARATAEKGGCVYRKYVPFNPDDAAVLRAAEKVAKESINTTYGRYAWNVLVAAVERRQSRLQTHVFVCPECGPGVKADEDHCCATCGADCKVRRQSRLKRGGR
jgi:rRNA maturation endonuclease Nob1